MARTTGSSGERTREAIRLAAIDHICAHGYEATSLRALAAGIGMHGGSLYNHIASKQDLLVGIMRRVMDDLLREAAARLDGIESPLDALRAFVDFHIDFHVARRQEVFIGNMELRSLTPENHAAVVALRTRYEDRLRRILEDGHAAGLWRVADPRVATYALIAMLSGVCTWYRPGGRLSKQALIDIHTGLVLNGVGAGMAV
ncbi:MAG: TetR/AcrR family transcriptional regulator [Hyphomicrobiales bacterium]|nr:TetR/AcrR family transcriptional regulator [Hyphomicrobiales bacterium]